MLTINRAIVKKVAIRVFMLVCRKVAGGCRLFDSTNIGMPRFLVQVNGVNSMTVVRITTLGIDGWYFGMDSPAWKRRGLVFPCRAVQRGQLFERQIPIFVVLNFLFGQHLLQRLGEGVGVGLSEMIGELLGRNPGAVCQRYIIAHLLTDSR